REYAATATTTATSDTFAVSSNPYRVDSSAPGVPTVSTAWTTPASTSAATAVAAHTDHTGRIAASSRPSARRSRMPASTTRPPSQNAAAARWTVPAATDAAGTGVVTGWPATGQVPRPTVPSTASTARSPRVARPAVTRRSSHAAAASTPGRTRSARPSVVASTSATAAAETSATGPPGVSATSSQTPATGP